MMMVILKKIDLFMYNIISGNNFLGRNKILSSCGVFSLRHDEGIYSKGITLQVKLYILLQF